jgi:hypothetical protein
MAALQDIFSFIFPQLDYLRQEGISVYAVSGTSRCLFSDKYKNADRFI